MSEVLVVIVRSIIAFFSLLIFAKILGKQQISQLTFFDYVLGITIGSIASELTVDLESRAWAHWIGLFSWAALGFLMEYVTLKWRYAAKFIEGEPTIVIMNGKVMENALRKMKYNVSDIMELLRVKDVFDLNEVDFAIIEPNGQLSVLRKPQYESIKAKDLKIKNKPSGISTELIYDGVLNEENLKQLNKNKNWLEKQLKSHGINDISDVFIATLNPGGSFYVDTYKDHIKKLIDIGDYKGPY